MEYRGFDIIKRKRGLYWVLALGNFMGSATTLRGARQYIDLMIYEE